MRLLTRSQERKWLWKGFDFQKQKRIWTGEFEFIWIDDDKTYFIQNSAQSESKEEQKAESLSKRESCQSHLLQKWIAKNVDRF